MIIFFSFSLAKEYVKIPIIYENIMTAINMKKITKIYSILFTGVMFPYPTVVKTVKTK